LSPSKVERQEARRAEDAMDELNYWQPLSGRRFARRALLRSGSIVALGAGAAGLVGCGSRGTTSGSKSGAAPGTGSSGGPPQKGGVLAHRNVSDPDTLDIHSTSTYMSVWPETPCYNQVLQYDPKDPDNKIIPDLADSYEIAGDGKSVVFKLHSGVKFHDGSDFTSEDVKATIDWIMKPPEKKVSPRQGVLDAVDHVETPDALTAKFILKRPNPSLLANLATEFMVIGAKTDLAKGDLGTQLNGTGPFKLKSFTRGVGIELERDPNYWVKDRPYLDGVKFSLIPDENTAFTDFVGGKFHRYYPVLPANVDRIERETGGKAKAYSPLGLSRNFVFFNGPKKPFNDTRVRQAISLALDRQTAIQVIMGGYAVPGGYMQPGGQWAIPSDQLKKIPGYDKADVGEAKKLLAAAGVTEPLTGVILTRIDTLFQDHATFVQGTLQKAFGWNFKIDVKDNAAAYSQAYAGKFDLIAWTVAVSVDDPDATFSEVATTKAVRNWSKIYDTEADALFDKQSQTIDTAQRKPIVQQMELKYLSNYQVLGMFFQKANHGLWSQVQNYKLPSALYTNQRYEEVWLSKA
jgi:peptide/nickel transport system substrate-binding protein